MTVRTMLKIPVLSIVLTLLLAATPIFAAPPSGKNDTLPSGKRVLIISIDGMRPDVLLRAKAPNIRELTTHGSFTFWAESTDLAITLPTHVSMLTGVSPAKHRITWNDDRHAGSGVLKVPTIFDLTKKAGYSTAMVVGKHKLCIMARPGSVECTMASGTTGEDALAISALASELLRRQQPQVMFVHFPDPDTAGHASGWGSPEQVASADRVDQGIGMLMSTLRELGLKDKTLIIITADHGGSGRSHGARVPFSHFIPWIAVGPGVRENYDLTNEPKLAVHVEDVFATALNFLGVPIPAVTDGKAILSIYGSSFSTFEHPKPTPLSPPLSGGKHLIRGGLEGFAAKE
ncbi:MAG: alkaline phosphatase family protein [Desulfuromonadales bacterium]|nr:alkaline phosphatase family protein [Desulfuromonadales bacterium]